LYFSDRYGKKGVSNNEAEEYIENFAIREDTAPTTEQDAETGSKDSDTSDVSIRDVYPQLFLASSPQNVKTTRSGSFGITPSKLHPLPGSLHSSNSAGTSPFKVSLLETPLVNGKRRLFQVSENPHQSSALPPNRMKPLSENGISNTSLFHLLII